MMNLLSEEGMDNLIAGLSGQSMRDSLRNPPKYHIQRLESKFSVRTELEAQIPVLAEQGAAIPHEVLEFTVYHETAWSPSAPNSEVGS